MNKWLNIYKSSVHSLNTRQHSFGISNAKNFSEYHFLIRFFTFFTYLFNKLRFGSLLSDPTEYCALGVEHDDFVSSGFNELSFEFCSRLTNDVDDPMLFVSLWLRRGFKLLRIDFCGEFSRGVAFCSVSSFCSLFVCLLPFPVCSEASSDALSVVSWFSAVSFSSKSASKLWLRLRFIDGIGGRWETVVAELRLPFPLSVKVLLNSFRFWIGCVRPPDGKPFIHLFFFGLSAFDDFDTLLAAASEAASSQSDARPLSFSLSESLLCIRW